MILKSNKNKEIILKFLNLYTYEIHHISSEINNCNKFSKSERIIDYILYLHKPLFMDV